MNRTAAVEHVEKSLAAVDWRLTAIDGARLAEDRLDHLSRELPVDATLALSMMLFMVLTAVFLVVVEQITDTRRNREFERELAAWRRRLRGRYRSRGA